jgi:DNA-binding HxlR family transcriptional regulator
MQRTDFSEMVCSIARSLAVAGEPWSPLVLRDVWVGINRFDDLQRDLGISRKVLAERLKHLVEEGMLERRLSPRSQPLVPETERDRRRSTAIPPTTKPPHTAGASAKWS